MPTYDYRCRRCGVELEIFQAITERAKRKCPHCGESGLERQIGAGAGILFKGSGFYQTDYRSAAYNQAQKAEQGDGAAKAGEQGGKDGKARTSESGTGAKAEPQKKAETKDQPKGAQ